MGLICYICNRKQFKQTINNQQNKMNKAKLLKWRVGTQRVLTCCLAVWVLTACSDDDGLSAGDPNYFTSSRGQFTATIDDGNGGETTL